MKESQKFFEAIYKDCSKRCSAKDRSKDLKTVRLRIVDEGLSFLTITLPNFSDTFFQCLENKAVTTSSFIGWKKKGCLPAFLWGFTSLVFDLHTGELRDDADISSIRAIRQICNFFKKIKVACNTTRVNKALETYVATDRNLGFDPFSGEKDYYNRFKDVCRVIVSSICGERVESEDLIPHHGPGSTFERAKGNSKYRPKLYSWYTQLEPWFDRSCVFNTDLSYHDSLEDYRSTLVDSVVRVHTVPKTMKGPRIIALEPVTVQFVQQSIKDYLVERIESSPLTGGHVNFTDQGINQRLALESSSTRAFATLDMSEASDRVCAKHIYDMMSVNPDLRSMIFSCRSHYAKVLGSEICLNKFASMGSALCFPMESLYFFSIAVHSMLELQGLSPTHNNIAKMCRKVYVYGDDIIIPTDVADSVITALTKFGNVVSPKKSFISGFFRESCGVDAYKGVDITPTYLRHPLPQKRDMVSEIVSLIDTANQLFDKQYYSSYIFIKDAVEQLTGKLPAVSDRSPGLGWRYTDDLETHRYNRDLQRYEVRTLVPSVVMKKDGLTGYNALSKCLLMLTLKQRSQPADAYSNAFLDKAQSKNAKLKSTMLALQAKVNDEHLRRSPRRGALTLKLRWVPRD